MKFNFFVLIFLGLSAIVYSQTDHAHIFTGSLTADAKLVLCDYNVVENPQIKLINENKKSPMLAGLMSLVIPGAGEIYAEEYLKAGIFVAIEAAVITTAVIYDGKGDDKTIQFQKYADDYTNNDPVTGHNWSVVRYANSLIDDPKYDDNQKAELRTKIFKSNYADPNIPPWLKVNWSELNVIETGSHHLPRYGEQQYYELIGKYHQFTAGWNDFQSGNNIEDLTPNFRFYSGMRGDANDMYTVAKTAVIGIYLNHFLSGLDAVWSTVSYNKDLTVKVRVENIQFADHAEFYPKVYLTYNF